MYYYLGTGIIIHAAEHTTKRFIEKATMDQPSKSVQPNLTSLNKEWTL
jgi:hypothetical protein